jgi:thioredoxin 1
MNDSSSGDDPDSIRERKARELQERITDPKTPIAVENAAQFEELVTDHSPVLVDFYADWCGPCKLLEPTVERVAQETSGTVLKVDVDTHQALARRYDVRGVPTLSLFVDGEPTERVVGVQDEATLRKLIESHV